MANHTISQITLPNGDVCYLKDSNLVASRVYLSNSSISNISEALLTIPTNYAGTIKSDGPVTSTLTGGKVSAIVFGTVCRLTDTIYEFFGRQANSENIFFWRITFNSARTSITVGNVYKLTGSAV